MKTDAKNIATILPEEDRLLKHYAFFTLRVMEPQISGNTSTAFASINVRDIKQIRIPLPPLDEQRALVAELQAEQELVDANRRLVARMESKVRAAVGRIWEG